MEYKHHVNTIEYKHHVNTIPICQFISVSGWDKPLHHQAQQPCAAVRSLRLGRLGAAAPKDATGDWIFLT